MTTAPFIHDPDARLDYAFDWSAWLDSDDSETIASYTVAVASGDVTIDTDSEDAGVVTVWLEDGTASTRAKVTCHIVTSVGREDDRTMTLSIRQR